MFGRDAVCSLSRRNKICNSLYGVRFLSVIHSVQETCTRVWIHSSTQYLSSVDGEVSMTTFKLWPLSSQFQNPVFIVHGWVNPRSATDFVTRRKKLCSG
jgi:hypothetical protein